jgi:DNA repair protein RecO (recombination protein O)
MSSFSTPAIVLRCIDYGEYDVVITLFTLRNGKISAIAKSAKKSKKRFAGILELFSILDVVCSVGRKKGLPVLQEAALKYPFFDIRSSILKTAYASYWAELINEWMESGQKQVQLYQLFEYVLRELDLSRVSEAALSILFQIKFMAIAGLVPNLRQCSVCRVEIEKIRETRVQFDFAKGGILCDECTSKTLQKPFLSKGIIKQLLWIEKGDLAKAVRVRFSSDALRESSEFLETFVPYHVGKEPRSLKFLKQIRKW